MIVKFVFSYILLMICTFSVYGQLENRHIRDGNKRLSDSLFEEAELSFRRALAENKASTKAGFNLGNALYRQQKLDEAINQYEQVIADMELPEDQAKGYHNIGNAYMQSGKFEESVEAYKKGLRLNPKDDHTRYNLAVAMKKLKEQPPQQQNSQEEQKQDENQDQDQSEDQQQNQSQENRDEGDQEDQNQNEQQQPSDQDQQEEQEEQEAQAQPREDEISQEDAERILQALENEERELQKELQEKNAKSQKVIIEKDW